MLKTKLDFYFRTDEVRKEKLVFLFLRNVIEHNYLLMENAPQKCLDKPPWYYALIIHLRFLCGVSIV